MGYGAFGLLRKYLFVKLGISCVISSIRLRSALSTAHHQASVYCPSDCRPSDCRGPNSRSSFLTGPCLLHLGLGNLQRQRYHVSGASRPGTAVRSASHMRCNQSSSEVVVRTKIMQKHRSDNGWHFTLRKDAVAFCFESARHRWNH